MYNDDRLPDDTSLIHPLSCESETKRINGRIARWVSRRSYWSIALAITLPVLVFKLFDFFGAADAIPYQHRYYIQQYLVVAAIFLPGAIRPFSWRQGLILALIAGVVCALEETQQYPKGITYPYFLLIWTPPIMGISDWAIRPPRQARLIAWTVLVTGALVFLIPAIAGPLRQFSDLHADFKSGSTSHHVHLTEPLIALLQATLTWSAIGVAHRLAGKSGRVVPTIAFFGMAMCIAWFLVFFDIIVPRLAVRSLEQRGRFSRTYAVWVLDVSQSRATVDQVLLRAVESADWSEQPNPLVWDYRKMCIDSLAKRDRQATARELVSLLKRKPSSALARYASRIFADERCYDASPEMLRYALMGDSECTQMLENLGVPQGGLAILRAAATTHALFDVPPMGRDWKIDSEYQRRLIKLLGKDVGATWLGWAQFYDSSIDQFPTPLTPSQATETQRVAHAFTVFWLTEGSLQKAGRLDKVPRPDFDVAGTALEQEVFKYRDAAEELLRK